MRIQVNWCAWVPVF